MDDQQDIRVLGEGSSTATTTPRRRRRAVQQNQQLALDKIPERADLQSTSINENAPSTPLKPVRRRQKSQLQSIEKEESLPKEVKDNAEDPGTEMQELDKTEPLTNSLYQDQEDQLHEEENTEESQQNPEDNLNTQEGAHNGEDQNEMKPQEETETKKKKPTQVIFVESMVKLRNHLSNIRCGYGKVLQNQQ